MLNRDIAPSSQEVLVPGLETRSTSNREMIGNKFDKYWQKIMPTVLTQTVYTMDIKIHQLVQNNRAGSAHMLVTTNSLLLIRCCLAANAKYCY